jgi:hypothetical protein
MGVWDDLERRKSFIRWHSRSYDRDWIVNADARTYRDAQGLPGPGEEIVRASENDLWALAYRDVPRRDVAQPVYP